MGQFTSILRSLSAAKFAEIMQASPRKAKEIYFHRHNIRAPSAGRFVKPGAKTELRLNRLFEILRDTDDEDMCEEILRSWLVTKNDMLAAALDHLGIPHERGLTDSEEVKKFEQLKSSEARTLFKKLSNVAPAEDVRIYLKFMGTPEVDLLN